MIGKSQSNGRLGLFAQAFFIIWMSVICTGYLVLQAPYTVEAIVTQFPAMYFLVDLRTSIAPWFTSEYKK
jgi:hypothetical protein